MYTPEDWKDEMQKRRTRYYKHAQYTEILFWATVVVVTIGLIIIIGEATVVVSKLLGTI